MMNATLAGDRVSYTKATNRKSNELNRASFLVPFRLAWIVPGRFCRTVKPERL